MDACPRYLCTCVYVIVCVSARKKAPVNLLMCPFELYMFIGVSMQLRVVFKYDFLVLIPYCWSVALEKKKKKKTHGRGGSNAHLNFVQIHYCVAFRTMNTIKMLKILRVQNYSRLS